MIPGSQENIIDPNQQEALGWRREVHKFRIEVVRRGNGINLQDAQMLRTLADIFAGVLPLNNTSPLELGEKFQEDRFEYQRAIEDINNDGQYSDVECAEAIWKLTNAFVERCTTFMYDTLFVKAQKRKKETTEGIGYGRIR